MNRLLLEAGGIVVLGLILWGLWVHHDHVQQQIGAQKIIDASKQAVEAQKVVDTRTLEEAKKDHADEARKLADGYAAALAGIKPRVVLLHVSSPGSVPAPTPGGDQGGPAADGPQSCAMSGDYQYALDVFAHRLDELNADAREVNKALH